DFHSRFKTYFLNRPRELLLPFQHLNAYNGRHSMFRKVQVALVSPLVLAWLACLYHVSSTPDRRPHQPPPSAIETSKQPESSTNAEFAAHVEQLKKNLPSAAFTILIQRPSAIIGDEPQKAAN